MVAISGSLFINGLREVGSALKTQIKNVSSVLAHIGSITNTGIDYSPSSASSYKQNLPPDPGMELTATINPLINDFQPRPKKRPMKIAHRIEPVKKRRAPLPPLSPVLITQLEKTIARDKQSEAWYARYNSSSAGLTPIRRAPLPPLSEQLISRLEQMIERDRQSPERMMMTDLKLAIKDVQFNMQMRKAK